MFCLNFQYFVVVTCTNSEPDPGWLDNVNGPIGLITGIVTGFLKIVPVSKNKITDLVPIDYTVNALISVMWDTVNRYVIKYKYYQNYIL